MNKDSLYEQYETLLFFNRGTNDENIGAKKTAYRILWSACLLLQKELKGFTVEKDNGLRKGINSLGHRFNKFGIINF